MNVECADVRDLAPELALGSLDGAVRAEVLVHIAHCPACRAEVRELADVVDGLAGLGPVVEPPPGLAERVLDAIRAEAAVVVPAAAPTRRRWRTVHLATAAVLAAAIGIGATIAIAASRHSTSPAAVALNARTLQIEPMIGVDDHQLGDAYISRGQDPWVLVNVTYGLQGQSYRLVGVDGDGQVVDIGPMRSMTAGRWAWAGRVDQAASLVELRIVDANGAVACRADMV
jgi:anti-sigma-K factor RskA